MPLVLWCVERVLQVGLFDVRGALSWVILLAWVESVLSGNVFLGGLLLL